MGGLTFVAGLLTPLAALGIVLAVALSVAGTGPGRFSLDHAIGWDDNITGAWWMLGVAVAAVAVTVLTLGVLRRRERLQTAAP